MVMLDDSQLLLIQARIGITSGIFRKTIEYLPTSLREQMFIRHKTSRRGNIIVKMKDVKIVESPKTNKVKRTPRPKSPRALARMKKKSVEQSQPFIGPALPPLGRGVSRATSRTKRGPQHPDLHKSSSRPTSVGTVARSRSQLNLDPPGNEPRRSARLRVLDTNRSQRTTKLSKEVITLRF